MTDQMKMRMITATFHIQQSMETLMLYTTDEKGREYLKKLEDFAEYLRKEEEKLMEKGD